MTTAPGAALRDSGQAIFEDKVRKLKLNAFAASCYTIVVGAIIMAIFHGVANGWDAWEPFATSMFGVVAMAAAPVIAYGRGSTAIISCVAVWSLNLALVATLFVVGGVMSNLAPALLLAPSLSSFFMQRLGVLISDTFMVLAVGALMALQLNGQISDRYLLTGDGGVVATSVVLVSTLICIAALKFIEGKLNEHMMNLLVMSQRQATAADAAKSQFLATMSHELRTPMNGVIGMSQILLKEPLIDRQRKIVEIIESSARSLLAIINDVLDISRIEVGKMTIRDELFDLSELVHSVVDSLDAMAVQKGLDLSLDCNCTRIGTVRGDGARVRQILVNLVGNAVKFTREGTVKLLVEPRGGGRIAFAVSDTGPGIAPADQERIFSRFHQTDGSHTRQHGGSGLGLAICRELTMLMNGALTVESTPGQGSTFLLELPLASMAPKWEAPPEETQENETYQNAPSVLLVEDNATNRAVVTAALSPLNIRITEVEDGGAARAALNARRYDLVLLDIQIPVISGDQVLAEIRAGHGPNRHTPFLVLTADAMPGREEIFLSAGADGYLAKPLNIDVLVKRVTGFLRPDRDAATELRKIG